ncbi:MAG: Trk family potassium uptake protein [Clostridiales bacterium]|nr:Trk family potassium uptake protein [Clostridiales bacterium]
MGFLKIKKLKFTATQVLVIGFFLLIMLGTFLLSLPIASRGGEWGGFVDSLFTATSATCVTGLIAFDTFSHWTIFGQLVIITLIQIGGIGFMTIISMIAVILKKKINLHERLILMQSAGSMQVSGVVTLIRKVVIGTVIFEGLGAIAFATRFVPKMGWKLGIYNSVFHSISAFCNAGFDLMGRYQPFSSFTDYTGDVVVNFTIMLLIIMGGIGFFVWTDLIKKRLKFSKLELHTKLVIVTTASLLIVGTALCYAFEYNHSLAHLTGWKKLMGAAFMSVTARTAGFNTVNLSQLSDSGSIINDILMFVGGSPGSTAGGIKTTTLAVLILSVIASVRNNPDINVFKKRIESRTVRQATAIATIYFCGFLAATCTICAIESLSIKEVAFEVCSAIGTVGLTMGITQSLTDISKVILALLMFAGRIGGLTFVLGFAQRREIVPVERPYEKILVG